ncbi:MAG: TlpA family protein disulfide reductase [Fimbriimonadales bacterium]|nr:TlpA family protein disulfide reductase [Fimbriimonadales bacterium]
MTKLPRTNLRDLQRRLAGQRGKVVVLNFWATWCQPCVEEFPALVKLYNNYRKRGVMVIAISVDDPETADELIQPFLKRQRATFPVLVLNEDPDRFIRNFDKEWGGEVPRTYVYSKSGKRLKAWSGARSYEEFEKEVKEALKKK